MKVIVVAVIASFLLIGTLGFGQTAEAANPWEFSEDNCQVEGRNYLDFAYYTATNTNTGRIACWMDLTGPLHDLSPS